MIASRRLSQNDERKIAAAGATAGRKNAIFMYVEAGRKIQICPSFSIAPTQKADLIVEIHEDFLKSLHLNSTRSSKMLAASSPVVTRIWPLPS